MSELSWFVYIKSHVKLHVKSKALEWIACKHARPVIRITVTLLIFLPLIALFGKKKEEEKKKRASTQMRMLCWLCLLTFNHLTKDNGVTFLTMNWTSATAFEMPLWKKKDILLFTNGSYIFICVEPFSFSPKINIFTKKLIYYQYCSIWLQGFIHIRVYVYICTIS